MGKKGTSHIVSDLAELLGLEMEYVEKCPRQIISKKEAFPDGIFTAQLRCSCEFGILS